MGGLFLSSIDMTAFCWFSYPPHYGMLNRSAERVRELHPEAALAVAIHRGDPAPTGTWDLVLETDFPRGSHLSGRAAAVGVINSIYWIVHCLNATRAVKLDSDMVLQSGDWLRATPMSAVQLGPHYLGCYSLEAWLVADVAASFNLLPPCSRHEANAICDRAGALAFARGLAPKIAARAGFPVDLVGLQTPCSA